MRNLITIWGKEEVQHQVQKGHHNRDVFKHIAQKVQTGCYNTDWEECHVKTKWKKSQFKHRHDANKKSRTWRQTMPFHKDLSSFHAMDRAIEILHTYSTTGELEESLAGTAPEQEMQAGPRRIRQQGAQEQVPRGHSARAKLVKLGHEESFPLLLVPISSQDVRASVHLQLELSFSDFFSGIAKSREHGTQEQGKNSDATDNGIQDLGSKAAFSTSWAVPALWSSSPQTASEHTGPGHHSPHCCHGSSRPIPLMPLTAYPPRHGECPPCLLPVQWPLQKHNPCDPQLGLSTLLLITQEPSEDNMQPRKVQLTPAPVAVTGTPGERQSPWGAGA